jgi:hypothetical protein
VHCAGLLCKWAYCCRANLAVYAAAVSVNAEALVLLVFSVVSTACFVSTLVYIGDWAVSLGRGNKGQNWLLRLKSLLALVLYVVVYLLL